MSVERRHLERRSRRLAGARRRRSRGGLEQVVQAANPLVYQGRSARLPLLWYADSWGWVVAWSYASDKRRIWLQFSKNASYEGICDYTQIAGPP